MSKRLLLATRNTGKLEELQRILDIELGPGEVELVGLSDVPTYDEVPETELTYVDNALIKAREGVARTGLATVADDSGIAVDALNGMPGVFSARWSGGHGNDVANVNLLLAQISDVDDARRGASFMCAAVLVLPDGREFTVDGEMRGSVIREPRGTNGFGYDPIFVPERETRTSAEMNSVEKDAISHRGKAMRSLATVIAKELY